MKPASYPVKVGVIGIGNMGWHHARVLSLLKDADLIGVADPNENRGKLAIEQFQCQWFGDYHELLKKVERILRNSKEGLNSIDIFRLRKETLVIFYIALKLCKLLKTNDPIEKKVKLSRIDLIFCFIKGIIGN